MKLPSTLSLLEKPTLANFEIIDSDMEDFAQSKQWIRLRQRGGRTRPKGRRTITIDSSPDSTSDSDHQTLAEFAKQRKEAQQLAETDLKNNKSGNTELIHVQLPEYEDGHPHHTFGDMSVTSRSSHKGTLYVDSQCMQPSGICSLNCRIPVQVS